MPARSYHGNNFSWELGRIIIKIRDNDNNVNNLSFGGAVLRVIIENNNRQLESVLNLKVLHLVRFGFLFDKFL